MIQIWTIAGIRNYQEKQEELDIFVGEEESQSIWNIEKGFNLIKMVNFFPFFLATLMAHRSSQAKDQTRATVVTMPNP